MMDGFFPAKRKIVLKILKKIVSVRYNMILCAVATIKHMATHVQPIVPELHLTQTELVKNKIILRPLRKCR